MQLHLPQTSVHFLGTSAAWPTADRNVSAIAVKRGGEVLLFDCGEGTQRQFQKSGLSYMAVSKIFLSHFHGDHFFGLPGLLKTFQLNERTDPLHVYGPPGTHRLLEYYAPIADVHDQFRVEGHELSNGSETRLDGYRILTAKTTHKAHNLAYALVEEARPGRFNKPTALNLGVLEGPSFRKLQMGEAVKSKDGRIVTPEMVLGAPRPGRKIVISGDTGPCEELVRLSDAADLLILEATYCEDMADRAQEYGHLTARQAAETARRANARRLILTHFSPRYTDTFQHLAEAQPVFLPTEAARDFSAFEVPLSE